MGRFDGDFWLLGWAVEMWQVEGSQSLFQRKTVGRIQSKQQFGRMREPRKACQSTEGLSPSFLVNLLIPGAAGQGSLTREGSWWQDPIYFVGFSNIHTASLRNLFKLRTLIESTTQASLPDSRVSYIPIFVLFLKQCPSLVRESVKKRQSITYSRCPPNG